MIAIVTTWNGRECLDEMQHSLGLLTGPIAHQFLVADCAERDVAFHPEWLVIGHDQNLGMARSVQDGWAAALAIPRVQYVLHWEDDMRLDRPLDLAHPVQILQENPDLAQLCFARHPVNGEEANGQLNARIAKSEHVEYHHDFTVHEDVFSLNPCLIPRRVCELGWPSGPLGVGNEAGFTEKIRAAGLKLATHGTPDDEPYVTHIGHERANAWQL